MWLKLTNNTSEIVISIKIPNFKSEGSQLSAGLKNLGG